MNKQLVFNLLKKTDDLIKSIGLDTSQHGGLQTQATTRASDEVRVAASRLREELKKDDQR